MTGTHSTQTLDAAAVAIRNADAIVIGTSNGLSIAEGYNIFADNEWFRMNFDDFQQRYGFSNVLEGCFFAFPTEEEKWAYWSRLATLVTYAKAPSELIPRCPKCGGSMEVDMADSKRSSRRLHGATNNAHSRNSPCATTIGASPSWSWVWAGETSW